MASVGSDSNAVILSEYASSLNVSNRQRYLEKISGIGDPYCIPEAQLSREALSPVTTAFR